MPTHAEQRLMPYSPEQLFDLVAAIEDYPEFLPWCVAARVRSRTGNVVVADLVIGFKMFRERFTSEVTLSYPERIDVKYARGPLRYLNNHWRFIPAENGQCMIDFHVDFEFRSFLLQKMIGVVFNEAVRRMVGSFERRASDVYGTALTPRPQPG
jgi:coenzyme Q-binding protein COQ10